MKHVLLHMDIYGGGPREVHKWNLITNEWV